MLKAIRWIFILTLLLYYPNLQAQQLSLGVGIGFNLKNFNHYVPSTEASFYTPFENFAQNEGWILAYRTPKQWILKITVSRFFPKAGLIIGDIGSRRARVIGLPDWTWSMHLGRQWNLWGSQFFIEPTLGLGFTNVKVRSINLKKNSDLELYDYTYRAGWTTNYQGALKLGYKWKKSSLSIKGIGLLGRKYYLTYHYIVNNTDMPRNVDISTKGDVIGLQLCYEYIFNLRKKKK